jgi:hypothetical protein
MDFREPSSPWDARRPHASTSPSQIIVTGERMFPACAAKTRTPISLVNAAPKRSLGVTGRRTARTHARRSEDRFMFDDAKHRKRSAANN